MKHRLGVLLGAGILAIGAAAPLHVMAQDGPPTPGEHGPHGHFGGAFMMVLHELDLSDAQKQTIRGYLQAAHQDARSEFQTLSPLRHAFETAAPTSAGYSTTVAQLAEAESKAAADRVQKQAALRAQIYGVLTDTQKATLASKLASLPQPSAPPM